MQPIRRFLNPALLVVTAALLATTLALPFTARPAEAATPEEAVDALVEAVNSGGGPAATAAFTPDGYFTDIRAGGSFALVGAAALNVGFSEITNTRVKIVDSTTSGNVVRGLSSSIDDDSRAAGVSRYLQPFTAVIRDGKIASFVLTYDLSDPQTVTYLEYLTEVESDGEDDGPPPGALEFAMAPGRDGAQTGSTAFFDFDEEGVTFIGTDITPGSEGVPQPAQLVAGDCPGLGAVIAPLASPVDGFSFTILSMSMDEFQAGDYAVIVRGSNNPGNIVSCGETESAEPLAAEEPAAPTTPPPPTGGITAPNTGTGSSDSAGNAWLLLATLALAGIALAATGATLRATRRTN